MTGYEIVVYPPRAARPRMSVIQGRRSRWITYHDGMRIESALPALGASE